MLSADIAGMVVGVTLFVMTGGVILLRPISKRLAELLAVMAQQKKEATQSNDLAQMRELLGTMESRLALLEERQNFSEALLASRHAQTSYALPEAE